MTTSRGSEPSQPAPAFRTAPGDSGQVGGHAWPGRRSGYDDDMENVGGVVRGDLLEGREHRPAIEAVLLPALFESDHVGLLAVNPAGVITAVAPAAEALLGYTEDELVGLPLHATLHPQRPDGSLMPESECPMTAALNSARAAEGRGEVLLRKDGSMVEVSWAAAPIVLASWRTGGVLAFYEAGRGPGAAVRELQRLGATHWANARLSLLADATHVLVSTSDLHEGLRDLCRLLVPTLADWAVIDLVNPHTGQLERAALAHRDPALEALGLSKLGVLPPPDPTVATPLSRVLLGGPTERIRTFAAPRDAPDELGRARMELFAALGSADAITAPLRTRTRTVGALTLVRSTNRRRYANEDVALATELAGRLAFAVENAWLLEREQRRGEEMQRALLPDLPERIGEIALVGIYRPADDQSQVGGDWYDAFCLSDGSTALVIGDVAGHDLYSATRMGAVRHKLRAIAGDRIASPSEVLGRLDRVLRRFAPDDMITAIYARLSPVGDGWRLQWSSAGHPSPLLIAPAEAPRLLTGPADLPLGVAPSVERRHAEIQLKPSSQLVFYTDGLVERSGEGIDVGMKRLVMASTPEVGGIRDRCERLITAMQVQGRDDVAVLGVALPDHPSGACSTDGLAS